MQRQNVHSVPADVHQRNVVVLLKLLIILTERGVALCEHFAVCDLTMVVRIFETEENIIPQKILAERFLLCPVNVDRQAHTEQYICGRCTRQPHGVGDGRKRQDEKHLSSFVLSCWKLMRLPPMA